MKDGFAGYLQFIDALTVNPSYGQIIFTFRLFRSKSPIGGEYTGYSMSAVSHKGSNCSRYLMRLHIMRMKALLTPWIRLCWIPNGYVEDDNAGQVRMANAGSR